jgi:hypothetical protein
MGLVCESGDVSHRCNLETRGAQSPTVGTYRSRVVIDGQDYIYYDYYGKNYIY